MTKESIITCWVLSTRLASVSWNPGFEDPRPVSESLYHSWGDDYLWTVGHSVDSIQIKCQTHMEP